MHRKLLVLVIGLLVPLAMFCQESAPTPAPAQSDHQTGRVPTSSVLTLDEVVRTALARSHEVQSAGHDVAALRHTVPQAEALPDPNVTVGWMGNTAPFSVMDGDPSSYRSVTAMQSIPYPGKRKLQGEIAGKDVAAAEASYEAVRRKVATEAETAFFDYFYYDRALQITLKDKDLLEKLSKISEARYRVGKGLQQDVLKSQMEISLLLQKIIVLRQKRATSQARLNTLMLRPPDAELPPAADVTLADTSTNLDSIYRLANVNDPGLERDQQLIKRSQAAVALARRQYLPDLSVGVMYQQRPMMPDMKGATFSINIPIFYRNKQRQAVEQAKEEVLAAQQSREDRANELKFQLKQAYLSAKAAKDLANLYTKAIIPQASLALESSMSGYEVGNADFLTVLSNFSTLLNYESDYYRQVADYRTALAQIESVVGVNLTRSQDASQSDVKVVTQ